MPRISRDSLMTLEAYDNARNEFRAKVLAHKKHRSIPLGENMTLLFEDELTIRYQVQEMLLVEKIFDEAGIQDEIDTYDPLIPDGSNFKATMMIEYPEVTERKRMLARLKGVEDRVWVQVEGFPRVYAIADEDLERENDEKTSAVHFVRFEFTKEMKAALKHGAGLGIGVDHPAYRAETANLPMESRSALVADLS